MERKTTKYFLLLLFFILLWVPLFQDNFHLFKGGGLKGAYTSPSDISFDLKKWFDGSYPEKKGEYLSFNYGFRSDFVRIYNQLKFWLFGVASTENVIIGKENYLYEQYYINEYLGTNYVGEEEINRKISWLKELQDTLHTKGIFLFTVYAPGKASFYPEFIPDKLMQQKQLHTNYASYVAASKKAGLNFIDMRAWFGAMKDTATYRLFPRGGIHWSTYGDYLAFDSLVRYIESNTGKDLPDLKLDSVQLSKKPRGRDYDAGDGLNLITEYFTDTLAYPFYSIREEKKEKLSLLMIGDSYYNEMFRIATPHVFKEDDFWYYFSNFQSHHNYYANKGDLKNVISRYNVVCIMYTDAGYSGFGSGFIEEAHKQLNVSRKDSIIVKN